MPKALGRAERGDRKVAPTRGPESPRYVRVALRLRLSGWKGAIQVDRGAGQGFVFLANDTTPGYTDTTPLPTAPAKWTYRAIYHVGDQQAGQWSAPVGVAVSA